MPKIHINQDKCKSCQLCIYFCPKKQIKLSDKFNKKGVHPVIFCAGEDCIGCGFCAIICPDACIEVEK